MPIFECSRCNEMTYSAFPGAVATPCPSCEGEYCRVLDGNFDDARRCGRNLAAGDHATLAYEDPSTVAPFCARYLTEGVNAGERVIAPLRDEMREGIASMLAADVELLVEWEDAEQIYGDFDADRIASMYDALIGGEERTTRVLAQLDDGLAGGVPPAELDRYEVAAHSIITSHGALAICLYDAGSLDPAVLEIGARRHTLAIEDGAIRRNERFEYQAA